MRHERSSTLLLYLIFLLPLPHPAALTEHGAAGPDADQLGQVNFPIACLAELQPPSRQNCDHLEGAHP
jgi:hypothetical protein